MKKITVIVLSFILVIVSQTAQAAPTPPPVIVVSTDARAETFISVYRIQNVDQWLANGWQVGAQVPWSGDIPADCRIHTRQRIPTQVYIHCGVGAAIKPIPEQGGVEGYLYRYGAGRPISIKLFGAP